MSNTGALRRSARTRSRSIKVSEPLVKAEVTSKYFSARIDDGDDSGSRKVVKNEPLEIELSAVPKRRKVVKHEPVEVEIPPEVPTTKVPPKNFEIIYNEVKLMREKIITPVDTVGCAFLPTKVSNLHTGPVYRYQLLVTLMLSSQTKDEINGQVMQTLQSTFKEKGYLDGLCVDAIMDISEQDLDKLIYKVGFHNRKLKYIKQTTAIVKLKYNSDIPKTIEEIMAFPGVGPKMGYLLLQAAWDITLGLGVDVHIFRLANMWNWVPKVKNPTPEHTRIELEKWLPRELWREFNPIMVGFGQSICQPRGRRCDLCTLPKYGRLCPNVDRALLKKVQLGTVSPRKIRGDLSGIMKVETVEKIETIAKIEDIEDLAR